MTQDVMRYNAIDEMKNNVISEYRKNTANKTVNPTNATLAYFQRFFRKVLQLTAQKTHRSVSNVLANNVIGIQLLL